MLQRKIQCLTSVSASVKWARGWEPFLPSHTGRKGSGDHVGGMGLSDWVRGEWHFVAPWASVFSSVTAGLGPDDPKSPPSSGICNVDD